MRKADTDRGEGEEKEDDDDDAAPETPTSWKSAACDVCSRSNKLDNNKNTKREESVGEWNEN
jgi:hypothetical protein